MITDHLRGNLDWVGIPFANTVSSSKDANVRLLDYACGTGLFSRVRQYSTPSSFTQPDIRPDIRPLRHSNPRYRRLP
jgi:hypothetical protein